MLQRSTGTDRHKRLRAMTTRPATSFLSLQGKHDHKTAEVLALWPYLGGCAAKASISMGWQTLFQGIHLTRAKTMSVSCPITTVHGADKGFTTSNIFKILLVARKWSRQTTSAPTWRLHWSPSSLRRYLDPHRFDPLRSEETFYSSCGTIPSKLSSPMRQSLCQQPLFSHSVLFGNHVWSSCGGNYRRGPAYSSQDTHTSHIDT